MRENKNINFIKVSGEQIPLIILILEILIFCLIAGSGFYGIANLRGMLVAISQDGIIAIGVTLLIICGSLDLSVGANKFISASMAVKTYLYTDNLILAILAGLATGLAIGIFNGVIVAKGKVNPFIATLGVYITLGGLQTWIFMGRREDTPHLGAFTDMSNGKLFQIPFPIWACLIFILIGGIILNKTRLGKYIFAIGGDKDVSQLMGIPVDRYKIIVHSLVGLFCGVAGVFTAARSGAVSPLSGDSTMFIIIGAVVLGGTSFRGGRGAIYKTVIGMLIYAIFENGFNHIGLSYYYNYFIWGGLLVMATIIDNYKYRKTLLIA